MAMILMISLLTATFAGFSVFADTSDADNKSGTVCNSALLEDANLIHFAPSNKTHFLPTDSIQLLYIVETPYTVDRVEGEAEGFGIISLSKLPSDEKKIEIKLSAPMNEGACSLEFDVFLKEDTESDSEEVISSKLYGLNTEYSVFVNYHSEERALDNYLSFMVNTERMTEDDAEEIKNSYTSSGITETVDVSSFNGNSAQASRAATDTSITYVIQWKDGGGNIHPLNAAKVEIYDDDGSTDELLTTLQTNINGTVQYNFTNVTTGENGGYDLYCVIYAENDYATVVDTNNRVYSQTSTVYSNIATGQSVTVTVTIQLNYDKCRALQMLQPLVVAREYAVAVLDNYLYDVKLVYPYTPATSNGLKSGYNSEDKTIFIYSAANADGENSKGLASYESWDVITHEYGHHVQYYWGISNSVGGSHVYTNNLAVSNFSDTFGKFEGCSLAWGEGWASTFGVIAQHYYEDNHSGTLTSIRYSTQNTTPYVADAYFDDYGGDTALSFETPVVVKGEACEINVMSVLWDLYDDPTTDDDQLYKSYREWWNLSTGGSTAVIWDMNDFVDNFYNKNTLWQQRAYLGEILTANGMAPGIRVSDCEAGTETTAPRVVWDKGGNGVVVDSNGIRHNFVNDTFEVVVLNSNYHLIFRSEVSGDTIFYRFTTSEWNSVQNAYGDVYYVCILGSDNDNTYDTGAYISAPVEFTKP